MRRTILLLTLLGTTACTQNAAEVVMLGDQEFATKQYARASENAVSSFASLMPASGSAPVESVEYAPVAYSAAGSESYDAMRARTSPSYSAAAPINNSSSMVMSDLPPPSANATQPQSVKLQPLADLATEKPTPAAVEVPIAEIDPTQSQVPMFHSKPEKRDGFIWPVQGKVVTHFGPQGKGKTSDGISIAAPAGEPVYAAADGQVVFAGDALKGYGNMVLVRHEGGKHTTYGHLSRSVVMRYDRVEQGEILGYVGDSGYASKPQLFFALQHGKTPVDPEHYLVSSFAALN